MRTNKVNFNLLVFVLSFFFISTANTQDLAPPQNLTYNIEDQNDVVLFWDQPSVTDSVLLHWDNGINSDSYGFLNGPAEWAAANRWDTSNLSPYDGWEVKKIRFYVVNKPYQLKIKIWVGNNPVEVYSQDIGDDEYEKDQWSEVALDQPFAIDASQEIRIGLYMNMLTPGTVVGLDEGPEVDGYGNWYMWRNNNNQWVWSKQAAANWNIQVLAVKPSEPVVLHWDDGHDDVNGFGFFTGPASFSCAAQWDPVHLNQYDGWKIKSMKFYIQSLAPTTVKLKIWEGNSFTEVYSQDVTDFNLNDWTEITLDTPFEIDASKKIRAGIFVDVPAPSGIIGCDTTPVITNYGFWVLYNGSWYNSQQAGSAHNMNLRLTLENGKDEKVMGEKGLLGYNIYRNDDKLNPEPVSATVYLDENLFNGVYNYYITAVYDEGESVPSDTVEVVIDMPGVYPPDSLALVDLYDSCNGVNWYLQDGWFELPMNEWHGITIENGRVVKIWLQLNNLTGDLPQSIGDLTALKDLYLPGNDLTSIPESIGNLDSLKWFSVAFNQLTDVPDEIGDMGSIIDLNLTEQLDLSELPESIGNLSTLKYLSLSGNHLTALPENVSNLKNLQFLYLSYNQLTHLPENIGNMDSLYYLRAYENNLDSLPQSFGNLSNLYALNLEYNNLSELPEGFGNLKNLYYCFIGNNNLKKLSDDFGGLSNLSILYAGNNILNSLPETFGNLSTLDTAVLAYNNLQTLPANMGNLTDLKYLTLSYNQISELPESFGNMSSLEQLFLSYNSIKFLPASFTDLTNVVLVSIPFNELYEIPSTIGNMSSVKVLYLNQNNISIIPESIGDMPNLETLFFNQNNIYDVPASIGNITTLKVLGLSDNNISELPASIGDLELDAFAVNGNNISELPSTMFDNQYDYLYIYENKLQFGSIEPFINVVPNYLYAPQAMIGNDTTIVIEEGTEFNYTIEVTGDYNNYQWSKGGLPLPDQTTNTLHFDEVTMENSGVYVLTVTNDIVDSLELKSKNVTLDIVTQTNEISDMEFNIYPNPVSGGYLNIVIPEYKDVVNVKLFDLQGRKVKEYNKVNKINSFDVSGVNKGLYVVQINTVDGKSSHKKIIVK